MPLPSRTPLSPEVTDTLLARSWASRTFSLERVTESATKGRASASWSAVDTLTGVLGEARPQDVERLAQQQERITHTLLVAGSRQAIAIETNDRLVLNGRRYYVVEVVNQGARGDYTRLLVEEREGP